MREILFRGKRIDNGKWVYGNLIKRLNYDELSVKYYAIQEITSVSCHNFARVIPETVGQYTGLKDKNGKKIFEGDIVKAIQTEYDEYKESEPFVFSFVGEMIFDDACFGLKAKKVIDFYSPFWKEENVELEVIGNIYDNKNLLEEEL